VPVALALRELPKYLVLAPNSTVRLDVHLESPACEIDVALHNPRPGRSFVLLIGHPEGPFVQRVRLAGRARVYFDPQSPGDYVLLLSNPDREPVVLRLRARAVGSVRTVEPWPPKKRRDRATVSHRSPRPAPSPHGPRRARRRSAG
jgi:hypothetical protein